MTDSLQAGLCEKNSQSAELAALEHLEKSP